jgi:hypothetical protein
MHYCVNYLFPYVCIVLRTFVWSFLSCVPLFSCTQIQVHTLVFFSYFNITNMSPLSLVSYIWNLALLNLLMLVLLVSYPVCIHTPCLLDCKVRIGKCCVSWYLNSALLGSVDTLSYLTKWWINLAKLLLYLLY